MKWAVYDLCSNSPSFDFFQFLQPALHRGAEGVRFIGRYLDPGSPYGTEVEQKSRFDSIVAPIVRMMGLASEVVIEATYDDVVWPEIPSQQFMSHWGVHCRDLPRPYPLMPSKEALDRVGDILKGKRPVVVTLRHYDFQKKRNSGPDWRKWAADHEAVLIDDWFDKPIDLDERMAYYEHASMNIGVGGGPMSTNILSYRPYVVFKVLCDEKPTREAYNLDRGLGKIGQQLPYATKRQKLVWHDDDSYNEIEKEFQEVMTR